jgi:hypothetical protein
MNGFDVQKWKRTEEIAALCGASWEVREGFKCFDHHGSIMGHFETVNEAFAFICGYERGRNRRG